jgi:hypothetical protein
MASRANAEARETYLVEHYRPGYDAEQLERFAERVRNAVTALEQEGKPVRLLGSLIVPDDEAFLSLVEATSEQLVHEAYRRAGIPFERISRSRVLADSERE